MAEDLSRRLELGRRLLGARLREVRNQLGRPLADAAASAGISKSYLSAIEHGRRLPSLEVLDGLAGALNVTVTQILAGLYPWDAAKPPRTVASVRDERRGS